jgi:hypothetical protein
MIQPEQKPGLQKFDIHTAVITRPGWLESGCLDILFINTAPLVGGATVTVRDLALLPGKFLSISGNQDELDVSQYEIIFGAGIPQCTVIRKLYRDK